MQPGVLSAAFLSAFSVSVFALQWWQRPNYPAPVWLALFLVALYGIVASAFPRLRRVALPVLAAEAGAAIALLVVMQSFHMTTETSIETFATGSGARIVGVIADEPDRRPMLTRYTVEATEITMRGTVTKISGKVLVTHRDGWPEFQYGDEVSAAGILERPGQIEEFSYDHYLSRFGIYAVMPRARMARISDGHGSEFFAFLYRTKARFERQITRIYPEPSASLLMGLLTGSRRGIPEQVNKDFQDAGLTHIVAISGFNITIVLAVVMAMLFFLPLRLRFIPAVAAIILFTLLVGASASVTRAAIMGILGLLAIQAGRQRDSRLLILWALFLMLLWNPRQLWYDAGFQLSFLAVAGIAEVAPLLKKSGKILPESFGIREAAIATVAAQVFVVPWVAVLFGRISLVAVLSNTLVAPAVPLAMLFGFLGTLASFLFFPLGQLISLIAFGFLEWIILVADFTARIPFAAFTVNSSPAMIVPYYVVLVGVLLWLQRPACGRDRSVVDLR